MIIAFAFPPNKRVGALRANYWYKELSNEFNCNTTVITAERTASGDNVHVVPKIGSSFINRFIKDDGVVWKKNIQLYLYKNDIPQPDLVIITGGPFMHFSLAKWFKNIYKSKVILDYRDPFAINPGFENSKLKVKIKLFFENRFNKSADALVTVNYFCGKLVCRFDEKPNAIVQNGYDETVEPELKKVELENPTFSYTGKFYFAPEPIVEAMTEMKLHFHCAGPDEVAPNEFNHPNGFIEYAQAVQLIANHDVAIIQTYGKDFQSTTKIFDYIRCKRAILIVSNNYIERGSIHEELKGYPNVFWAKNTKESIIESIAQIQTSTYTEPDQDFHLKYSRKFQMKKLVTLIQKIL
ncbi:MAG: hypothetical protein HRT57_08830 [Crocinitomicaceae bacterium]|nr:hypothetical protein [Crocinitomicaceae bacterium]